MRLYKDYREVADCVFSDLGWRKLLIDKTATGWAERNDRVLCTISGTGSSVLPSVMQSAT